jgi:hypothetical protein
MSSARRARKETETDRHERLPCLVLDLLPPPLIRPQQLLPLGLPTHPARPDDGPQHDDPRDPLDLVGFPHRIARHHLRKGVCHSHGHTRRGRRRGDAVREVLGWTVVVGRVPVCAHAHAHADGGGSRANATRTGGTGTPDDPKLDRGRVDLRPMHVILASLSVHLDPRHLVRKRAEHRGHARTAVAMDGCPHGGLAEGGLERTRAGERTGDVCVDEGVWKKRTGVEEAAEESKEDVGPRRRRRRRCRGGCGRREEGCRRVKEGVYDRRQGRRRRMSEDERLDEGRERAWVDGVRDKCVAECCGGHVERERGRRGDLHRDGQGRLKGELELLAGWAWLGLLLLGLLWLLLGVRVRACVRMRARTGGRIRGRGKGRREGWAPREATRRGRRWRSL